MTEERCVTGTPFALLEMKARIDECDARGINRLCELDEGGMRQVGFYGEVMIFRQCGAKRDEIGINRWLSASQMQQACPSQSVESVAPFVHARKCCELRGQAFRRKETVPAPEIAGVQQVPVNFEIVSERHSLNRRPGDRTSTVWAKS